MKKICRLLALFSALILVCLSMTSCNAIDEMRKNQAFYNKDGSITLHGTKYLPLPENELFYPYKEDVKNTISITEPDVPVLLSAIWGNEGTLYNDGEILAMYLGTTYYCREDKYEQYNALLAAPFTPTDYCYSYYVLDTDTMDYIKHYYKLTAVQKNAVDEILATVTPTVRDVNATYHFDYGEELYACDSTMLLCKESVNIQKFGNTYHLVEMNYDDEKGELEYVVPAEYTALFDAIIQASVDAAKAEEEYYGYDSFGYDMDYTII